MAKYETVSGIFEVNDNDIDRFFNKFPSATKVGVEPEIVEGEVDYDYDRSKGIRYKSDSYGKILDDIAYGVGNYIIDAANQAQSGDYTESMLDIIVDPKSVTKDQATQVLDLMQLQEQKGVSEDLQKWTQTMEEASNPFYGFFKATIENPKAAGEVIISSAVGQFNAFTSSPEVAALAGSAGLVQSKFGGPVLPLRIAAGLRGTMSTLGGVVETTSKIGELIKEEFDGQIPTEEQLLDLINDEQRFNKLRNKSLAKGLTIAAVDNFGGGMVTSSVAKTAKKGKKLAAAGKGLVGESIAGGGGEALSSAVIGEEIKAADVGLEILGQAGQGSIDIGSALITPGSYKVNGKKASIKDVNKILETATPEELSSIKIDVEGNEAFSNEVKNKINDATLETQIDAKVEDPADRKSLVDLEKQRAKAESDVKKTGIFQVPNAKGNLENIEMQINNIIGKYTAVDGRAKDVRARKKAAERVRADIADKVFSANLDFAKKHSAIYGLEVDDTMSIKDIEAEYGKEAAMSDGFIKGDKIIINKAVAKNTQAVNVGNHELLHGVLRKSIKENPDQFKNIRQDLKDQIGEKQWKSVEDRASSVYDETYMSENPEEWVTLTSDAIANGDITYSESVFQPLVDLFLPILRAAGFKKIKFDTGKDVFNFLKEYNRSIHKGALSSGIVKATEGKVDVEGIKLSKTASDKVQRIYEEVGATGAFDIINEFKPIVSKIVEKRSEAPGFDRQLLTDEIETGKRGILDLIGEYDPKSGVPLAAFINKFLPARAIEASRRVLGEEFTQDVTEAKGVMAEEVAEVEVEAKPKKKKIVLAERLGVTDKVSKAIEKIVPDLDIDKLTFKTLKNKVPEITGELFGISPKKIISLANITKKELQSAQMFINKNADVLIAMLPEGATASGTATGVPGSLLKAFYTKTDRARAAKTGSKAGLAIQQKNDINKKEFLETFGIIDGKPDRTDRNTSARVLALANLTGKMMSNQAVRQKIGEASIDTKKVVDRLKDGKSKVMFSKSTKLLSNYIIGDLSKQLGIELTPLIYMQKAGKDKLYTSQRDIDAPFKINNKETGETYKEAIVRGINEYLKLNPQYRDLIQKTMTGGVMSAGFFQTVEEFNNVINATSVEQKTYTKDPYNKDKRLSKKFIEKTKQKDYKKEQDGKLPLLLDFFKSVESHLKNNPLDIWIFEEMLKDTGKHQNTLTRILAPITAYPIDKNNNPIYNEEVVEEHTNPQNQIGKALLGAAQIGQLDKMWKAIGKSYMQLSLLKTDDVLINESGYQTSMPDVYYEKIVPRLLDGSLKLPDGLVSVVRLAESGVDLNNYYLINEGKTIAEFFGVEGVEVSKANEQIVKQLTGDIDIKFSKSSSKTNIKPNIDKTKKLNKAIAKSRKTTKQSKGITVLDFDDTLATTESLVKYTTPDGKTGTLNAEQFASTYQDLLDQGYVFDFSDFNKVVKGKLAPLFNKAIKLQGKFGPENMFVLTARPPQAQKAIYDFLKANGLNIPLKNITGLGNSTSEAKALWIADKVGEGYNDFYFADDALQNVQAVKNMLDQFDVKSKVQQAKVKFSKTLNTEFNDILQDVTGIESKKRFSAIKARKRGSDKGKFRYFIPPSHEDFVGLLYNFIGKGKLGNQHRDFFEQALVRPLNRAYRELNTARQSIANDYKNLNKQFPSVKDKLIKKTPDGDFTYQDAIRVYLWDKHGNKVPGLSETDQAGLVELVKSDPEIQAYADAINTISKREDYVTPTESWEAGDIRTDLDDATGRIGRTEFFTEFFENADIIFSQENMNKIEAAYGVEMVDALKDILYRTKTGRNRPSGQNAQVNKFMNWLNGAVASTMFFNIRSAVLQQMSLVNFINFSDNNILSAAKAFADQKQYWSDWSTIFNSDFMKQRRGGIKTDVNGAELAASVKDAKKPVQALIKKLLELGFLPTQIGDNIAIATGGSTFYRNRINTYLKQGLSKKEAESKAFVDFQVLAEATQQSARPDMVSQQQASPLGKIILAFQNVTSQFNRLGKKAFLDIKNRRITPGNTNQLQSDVSNLSRIAYYFAIQNLIFYSLQSALFMAMFSDDKEDERFLKKKERMINGSIDSVLRGSGVWGAALATLKNMALKRFDKKDKKANSNVYDVMAEALQVSPPIGIKARKLVQAERDLVWKKKLIDEMDTFDIENPIWSAYTSYIEGITNVPLNRMYNKTMNMREALDNQNSAFERLLMFSGWSKWNLGIEEVKKSKTKSKFGTKKSVKPKKSIKF